MTFPAIKNKINTQLFNGERAELYMQKWEPNFLANLKRVKICWRQSQHEEGMKTVMASCLKRELLRENEKQLQQPV